MSIFSDLEDTKKGAAATGISFNSLREGFNLIRPLFSNIHPAGMRKFSAIGASGKEAL